MWLCRSKDLFGSPFVRVGKYSFAATFSSRTPRRHDLVAYLLLHFSWRVGLLTAIFSPLVNSALFGMPPVGALPAILLKSVLMAVIGGYVAARFNKATILLLMVVVLSYQILGTLGEWAMKGDFWLAAQDFRIGIPGMLLQVLGGWFFINRLIRK